MSTETLDLTRTVDGAVVPAPGAWAIDASHSQAEFVARHLMVTKVRGGFDISSGSIVVAENPRESTVEVVLDAASVSTGDAQRDGHLTSADFFDAESFPTITFRSTSVEPAGSAWRMTGDLTIREVAKPVVLDFEFLGLVTDPWGGDKAAFSASTEIDREDWDLTWNVPLDGGGVLVSKSIKIDIEIQAAIGS